MAGEADLAGGGAGFGACCRVAVGLEAGGVALAALEWVFGAGGMGGAGCTVCLPLATLAGPPVPMGAGVWGAPGC